MAYNREWDKGKDGWNDHSWNDYPSRGNVRGREDDYYSEGKRRRFNNGVRSSPHIAYDILLQYKPVQNYDQSQGWDEGGYDNHNQSRANTQWTPQDHVDDRHWNAHGKKRQVPSEPSPHVIFLGLDPDFTEADVRRAFPFLSLHAEMAESFRR